MLMVNGQPASFAATGLQSHAQQQHSFEEGSLAILSVYIECCQWLWYTSISLARYEDPSKYSSPCKVAFRGIYFSYICIASPWERV